MAYQSHLDAGLRELALFAGAGGGILGGTILGWRTVCAVEHDAYAASVLLARQNDGLLPPFPIWDEVRTFDGRPWRGIVDVVSGGFPCQDISAAGKGAGITGERSGLWVEMARIIGEVRPRFVFVENSPMLVVRGLGTVLADLATLGFNARWGVLGAADVGAPHLRERIWIVAHHPGIGRGEGRQGRFDSSDSRQSEQSLSAVANAESQRIQRERRGDPDAWYGRADFVPGSQVVADADCHGLEKWLRKDGQSSRGECCQGGAEIGGGREVDTDPNSQRLEFGQGQRSYSRQKLATAERTDWWQSQPGLGGTADGLAERLVQPWTADWEDGTPRVATGVPARADRLKAIGNGQVPLCAATAWQILRNI